MRKKYVIGFFIITALIFILGLNVGTEDENTLNIYTAIEEEYLDDYLQGFKELYPEIKLNIVRDSSGVVSAKLMIEKDNPRADVAWGIPASSVLMMDKYNIFEPYTSKNLSNIDSRFYDTKNEEPTWVGTTAWMTAFTVNKVELEKKGLPIPESYEDLLDPIYSDSIIMPNPSSSGTGFLTVSAWIQLMGEEKAWEYMEELNKNIKSYSHSGSAPTKQTAKGEYLIGVGMDSVSLQTERKSKEITTVMPKEGSGWEMEVVGLIKKDKIKDSAKKFYDWALSKETMDKYAKNFSIITAKGYVPQDEERYPNGVQNQMINNDLIWAAQNRTRILREWEKRYGVSE